MPTGGFLWNGRRRRQRLVGSYPASTGICDARIVERRDHVVCQIDTDVFIPTLLNRGDNIQVVTSCSFLFLDRQVPGQHWNDSLHKRHMFFEANYLLEAISNRNRPSRVERDRCVQLALGDMRASSHTQEELDVELLGVA